MCFFLGLGSCDSEGIKEHEDTKFGEEIRNLLVGVGLDEFNNPKENIFYARSWSGIVMGNIIKFLKGEHKVD